jgi:hypothetical protein
MLEAGVIHFWPCRFYTLLHNGERPHAAGGKSVLILIFSVITVCKVGYHYLRS